MYSSTTHTKKEPYTKEEIKKLLTNHFSLPELKDFCLGTSIMDAKDLAENETANSLAWKIVNSAFNRQIETDLLQEFKKRRPEIYTQFIYTRRTRNGRTYKAPAAPDSRMGEEKMDKTRRDVDCLNGIVTLYSETELINPDLDTFHKSIGKTINSWRNTTPDMVESLLPSINWTQIDEFRKFNPKLEKYILKLEQLVGKVGGEKMEKMGAALNIFQQAKQEIEQSTMNLNDLCTEKFYRYGWSQQLQDEIFQVFLNIQHHSFDMIQSTPQIQGDLYDGIIYYVARLAERFHVNGSGSGRKA